MAPLESLLRTRIAAGKNLLLAELTPPSSGDPGPLRTAASRYAGKIHGLGISDNQHGVRMSALAAASVVAQQGVEPVLHVVTRDRNRTALVADYLGAQALGIRNVLCTSGTHQTVGAARSARAVFDVDTVQLLETYARLCTDGSLVGAEGLAGVEPLCLGAVACPFADPPEMQLMGLAKKIRAGARFCITHPVFDVGRFDAWWQSVVRHGLHEKAAFLAGVRVLTSARAAEECARLRPRAVVPDRVYQRVTSPGTAAGQRAAGIEVAVETVLALTRMPRLRGFELRGGGDDDAVLEVIARSGLGVA